MSKFKVGSLVYHTDGERRYGLGFVVEEAITGLSYNVRFNDGDKLVWVAASTLAPVSIAGEPQPESDNDEDDSSLDDILEEPRRSFIEKPEEKTGCWAAFCRRLS